MSNARDIADAGHQLTARVNFNGTLDENSGSLTAGENVLIRASYNVSSVYYNGTGDYTVNFATAMPDANYSVVAMGKSATSSYGQSWTTNVHQSYNPTSQSVRVVNSFQDDNDNSVSYVDSAWMFVVVFR